MLDRRYGVAELQEQVGNPDWTGTGSDGRPVVFGVEVRSGEQGRWTRARQAGRRRTNEKRRGQRRIIERSLDLGNHVGPKVQQALEGAGVIFIPADAAGGPGVRMKA